MKFPPTAVIYTSRFAVPVVTLDTKNAPAFSATEKLNGIDATNEEGTSGNALTVDEIPANCGYIDYTTMFELFEEELNGI